MPLIRVSDQVHEHLKHLTRESDLSVDAVLRDALDITGAQKARNYTAREELMPLEIYRWLILSAFPSGASSDSDRMAPMTRLPLQVHLSTSLDRWGFNNLFPTDFTYTAHAKARRMRWKMRFNNVFREMIKSKVLIAQGTKGKISSDEQYLMADGIQNDFLRIGLHLDTAKGDWWFTKLPESVNLNNWGTCNPITVDDERHTPISVVTDDYAEWLDRASFIWGRQKYENLKDLSEIVPPSDWVGPGGRMMTTITNSGIKTD
jgi:hypothetical protein